MTDLRTAAQQALEYMKSIGQMDMYPEDWAIVGRLEAALAQQAWVCPESPEHRYAKPGHCEDCGRTLVRAQQAYTDDLNQRIKLYVGSRCAPPQQAEPGEPVAQAMRDAAVYGVGISRDGKRIDPASIYAQQAEPVQEPVAWMVYTEGGTSAYVTDNPNDLVGAYRALALYTAPPQRKPLTEEEIPALAEKAWKPSVYCDAEALLGTDGLVALVRAVEAKHCIKE